jgi:hypothetical protein
MFSILDDEASVRFLDPISLDIMHDPVQLVDGHTYDRRSIQTWLNTLKKNGRQLISPLTNLPLSSETLTPNEELKNDLKQFLSSKSTVQASDIRFSLKSNIFHELGRFASLPVLEKLDLKSPKIIVIGNESHGKSTLLERIIGLPLFPKEKGICTRCVIRVHLRRCTADAPLAVAEITTKRKINLFSSSTESPVIFTAFDNIREKIQETMTELVAHDVQKRMILDDYEIIVKIRLPNCVNLDILDVPGLVTTTPAGVIQNLPQVTQNLALRILQQEKQDAIVLLVNDVRVPANQSRGCAIIQQAKVEHQTLGVLTKLDTFVSEDGDEVQDLEELLKGLTFPLGHGWMASASKKNSNNAPENTAGPLNELKMLHSISRREMDLFETKFSRLLPSQALGVEKIVQKIQQLYERFTHKNWIPVVAMTLKNDLFKLKGQLNDLGLVIPPDQDYLHLVTLINPKAELKFEFLDADYLKTLFSRLFDCLSNEFDALEISDLSSVRQLWETIAVYQKFFQSTINGKGQRGEERIVKPREVSREMEKMDTMIKISLREMFQALNVKLEPSEENVKSVFANLSQFTLDLAVNSALDEDCAHLKSNAALDNRATVAELKKVSSNKSDPSSEIPGKLAFPYIQYQEIYDFLTRYMFLPADLVKIAIEQKLCCNIRSAVTFVRYTQQKMAVSLFDLNPREPNQDSDMELKSVFAKLTQEMGYSVTDVLDAIVFENCQTIAQIVEAIETRQKPQSKTTAKEAKAETKENQNKFPPAPQPPISSVAPSNLGFSAQKPTSKKAPTPASWSYIPSSAPPKGSFFGTVASEKKQGTPEKPSAQSGFTFGGPPPPKIETQPTSSSFSFTVPATTGADFLPSETCTGAKSGYSFQRGSKGVGYYKDYSQQDNSNMRSPVAFSFGTLQPKQTEERPVPAPKFSFGFGAPPQMPVPSPFTFSNSHRDQKPAASSVPLPVPPMTSFSFGVPQATTLPIPPPPPPPPVPQFPFNTGLPTNNQFTNNFHFGSHHNDKQQGGKSIFDDPFPVKSKPAVPHNKASLVLERYPKIRIILEKVISDKLSHAQRLFIEWFQEFCKTVPTVADGLVSFEYFMNADNNNKVNCRLYWTNPDTLKRYPHMIINKWYEYVFQAFEEGITKNDFPTEDLTNLEEDCKEKRLALFKEIHENLQAQAALEALTEQIQSKL